MPIIVRLDVVMARRKVRSKALARAIAPGLGAGDVEILGIKPGAGEHGQPADRLGRGRDDPVGRLGAQAAGRRKDVVVLGAQRAAEIAGQDVAQEVGELHDQRLVEMEALAQHGWNEFAILVPTMLVNAVTEFLFNRFVVFRDSINTAVKS